jgi:uncharacterized membrane protein
MKEITKQGKIIPVLIVLVVLAVISSLLESVGLPRFVTSSILGLFLGMTITTLILAFIDLAKEK